MKLNEQEFFDLAMKVVAGHASASEQAELRALLADDPALKAEFERLRMDAELAREVMPLVEDTQATGPKLPEYARERLQTKVRQTLGRKPVEIRSGQWRWWIGLATATAAIALILVLNQPGSDPKQPPLVAINPPSSNMPPVVVTNRPSPNAPPVLVNKQPIPVPSIPPIAVTNRPNPSAPPVLVNKQPIPVPNIPPIAVTNRLVPNLNDSPVILIAMLDSVGTVRGTGEKPMELLQQQWKQAKPVEFDDAAKLKLWQENWPSGSKQAVVKVLYDRDAGELRIKVWRNGKTIEKVLVAKDAKDLSRLIIEADRFIQDQAR